MEFLRDRRSDARAARRPEIVATSLASGGRSRQLTHAKSGRVLVRESISRPIPPFVVGQKL
jgi:hypothetical protein